VSEPLVHRVDPPYEAAERPMLEAFLEFQRATLARKCEGLDDEQLRLRAVPPSTLSLLGLVRHAAEVERWWFRMVLSGEDVTWRWTTDDDPDGDFDGVDDADGPEMLAAWREECDLARHVVSGFVSLEDSVTVPSGHRAGSDVSLRWVLLHVIEEYARHNGHADLLRERIDGTVGI